mmetsp:Transcript_5412/g.8544  ORF Transcript_5412/g.8544 Transcript_5412/m.8544 type:complete len:84 (-) Transcript_5412:87-338(-)
MGHLSLQDRSLSTAYKSYEDFLFDLFKALWFHRPIEIHSRKQRFGSTDRVRFIRSSSQKTCLRRIVSSPKSRKLLRKAMSSSL